MLRFIVFFIAAISAIGISSSLSVAQDAHGESTDDATAKSIIAMEATWLSNLCGPRPDLSFIADDFHGTRRNGSRYGRDVATTKVDYAKKRAHDCHLGPTEVRFFGDFTAVGYGEDRWIEPAPDGTEAKFCQRWTDTWVKRKGQWQLVSAHDTLIPCEQ